MLASDQSWIQFAAQASDPFQFLAKILYQEGFSDYHQARSVGQDASASAYQIMSYLFAPRLVYCFLGLSICTGTIPAYWFTSCTCLLHLDCLISLLLYASENFSYAHFIAFYITASRLPLLRCLPHCLLSHLTLALNHCSQLTDHACHLTQCKHEKNRFQSSTYPPWSCTVQCFLRPHHVSTLSPLHSLQQQISFHTGAMLWQMNSMHLLVIKHGILYQLHPIATS